MLRQQHLFRTGHELKDDTKKFINGVLLRLLNILHNRSVDPSDVEFIGENDIFIFRGTNITLYSFSKTYHSTLPSYSETGLGNIRIENNDQITTMEELLSNIDDRKLDYLANQVWDDFLKNEFHFVEPLTIFFPTTYLSLPEDEMIKAQQEVAELLIDPALEAIEKKRRIVRVNPIFQGRDFYLETDLCFVLMEFKPPYTQIYSSIIEPTIREEGFRCLKSDEIFTTSSVIEDIWANINKSILIVAEISTNNPNVMYELGICHTIGKNVMMLTMNPDQIPFNFRHLRCYPYKNDIPGAEQLKLNIRSVIQQLKST